jgi:hypothetical protein
VLISKDVYQPIDIKQRFKQEGEETLDVGVVQ